MSVTSEKQARFALKFSMLVQYVFACGDRCTYGEVWRHPAATHGSRKSLHPEKVAGDLNLFKLDKHDRWRYQRSTEAHAKYGAFWKTLDPEAEWGGDDEREDGNHYSLGHGGRW